LGSKADDFKSSVEAEPCLPTACLGRGRIRNKFWGGLQSFIIYDCAIYEFVKRIKQYFPTKSGTVPEINFPPKNKNRRESKIIYEKVKRVYGNI